MSRQGIKQWMRQGPPGRVPEIGITCMRPLSLGFTIAQFFLLFKEKDK
jgi:hypothetical protein